VVLGGFILASSRVLSFSHLQRSSRLKISAQISRWPPSISISLLYCKGFWFFDHGVGCVRCQDMAVARLAMKGFEKDLMSI
jgi:hypothetical protein